MPDNNGLLLGFDFGLRQIGVAVGETHTGSARPLTIIKANEGQPDWSVLGRLLDEWQPAYLVVGLPLNMDGSESDMSARARKFANRLHGRFGCRVELHDERLSSREAKQSLNDDVNMGGRGRGTNYNKVDAIAAALILQSWLDNKK